MPENREDALSRLEIATRVFNVDSQMTTHYETIRAQFSGFVITITGLVLVFSGDSQAAGSSIAAFLVFLGLFAALVTNRFGHSAKFHWKLTGKMRQIIVKYDSKVNQKYRDISEAHTEDKFLRDIKTNNIWIIMNVLVPWSTALLVFFSRTPLSE